MALSAITSQLAHAMETDVAARNHNHNPLQNKVVHADIRVQSIEDEHKCSSSRAQGGQLVEQSMPSQAAILEQERAEQMQTWWNKAMKKHMNQPNGYANVAVLLIKWADELDELKTRKEAEELDALFRERFYYQTKIVELDLKAKPQHQLNSYISDFIRDYDGLNHLLIVYYTGHGLWRDDKECLELSATINPAMCQGIAREARANWNKAEEKLREDEVEGDVLTILDTCYSSNMVKSGREEKRKIELLSACLHDQTTAKPGPRSFTRALIDAMRVLLEGRKIFSTFQLSQTISLDPRRDDTPSQLWGRSQTKHHIFLAPLKPANQMERRPPGFRYTPGGFLTLCFGLKGASLTQEQIEFVAKTLSKGLNNKALVGLKEIKWIGMVPGPPVPRFDRVALVIHVIRQWRKLIRRKKEERASHAKMDGTSFQDAMDISPTTSQKRAYDGMDLPDAKRQYLDPSQPPSPPVSDTSRIDH